MDDNSLIISELRRLSDRIEALTAKMDEQQDEFHNYRMTALKDLHESKAAMQAEITRLDKVIVEIKSKIALVSAGVASFVTLIPFLWSLIMGKPEAAQPETPSSKAQVTHQIKDVKK